VEEPARDPHEPGGSPGIREAIRAHPVVTTVMVVCTVAGAIAGPLLLPEEWSLLRRLAGGVVAGGGTGLLLTATKMLG